MRTEEYDKVFNAAKNVNALYDNILMLLQNAQFQERAF